MKRAARLCFWVALLVLGLFVRPASAHLGAEQPRIVGRARPELPREGPRGRLEIVGDGTSPKLRLVPGRSEATGTFQIKNVGEGPLEVFRVGFEREEGLPRAPAGVGISSGERETKPLQPGEVRTYTVTWRWDESRAMQLYGTLAVETDSAAPGAAVYDATQVVALVADRRPSHLRSILSLAALAPLLATLFALLAKTRLHERRVAQIGAAIAAFAAAIACVPLASFARRLSREDGGWGLQHIERARMFGDVEYFVGVDGLSAPLLPLAAVVLFAAAASARPGRPSAASIVGWGGVLASATTFFVVSQSLALSAVALCVAAAAASGLVWSAAGAAQRSVALQVTIALGASAIAFVAFVVLVRSASFPSRLWDGTLVERTLALPELAREVAHGHVARDGARLLGMPFDRGAVTLLALALAGVGAIVPFHAWAPAVTRLGGSTAALLLGATSILSGVALSRFSVALYPEATRSASTLLCVLGLVSVALAGLRACVDSDLRDLVGRLAIASGGLALFSLGTATPAGIQGHLAITITRALALPLAALAVSALAERTGDTTLERGGGLARATPWLASLWVLALGAAALAPGSGGFWGALLAIVAAMGRAPWLALAMVGALALSTAGSLRGLSAVMGPPPAWWKASAHLEPNGGTPADLRRDDLPWALVLALLLVALAVGPRLWLDLSDATIMDVYRSAEPQGPTQVF